MHASEWIALITPGLTLTTAAIVGIFKLIRSVDRLGDKLENVVGNVVTLGDQVKDHEGRLRKGGL